MLTEWRWGHERAEVTDGLSLAVEVADGIKLPLNRADYNQQGSSGTLETFDHIRQIEQAVDEVLDATGLECPMPLLKARQALASLSEGQHLHVICTDPGSWRDFESFVAHTAHQLAARRHDDDTYHYVLIKGC